MASRGVIANSDYANFGPGAVDDGNANSDSNFFNSNGDSNGNANGVRPVASINWGYAINDCIRDNIETNTVLSLNDSQLMIN